MVVTTTAKHMHASLATQNNNSIAQKTKSVTLFLPLLFLFFPPLLVDWFGFRLCFGARAFVLDFVFSCQAPSLPLPLEAS